MKDVVDSDPIPLMRRHFSGAVFLPVWINRLQPQLV